ncbi:MAG: helix-turn-helix domain-containing protein [Phycisphaerae bacterium]
MTRMTHIRALIIDDDENVRRELTRGLVALSFDVVAFPALEPALEYLREAHRHVVIADLQMEGQAIAALGSALHAVAPRAAILGTLAFPEVGPVLEAMRAGIVDVLEKPVRMPALLEAIERQLAKRGLDLKSEDELSRFVGQRVRVLRARSELSQTHAANRAGISPSQLSQIESGQVNASLWTLARICQELDVPLSRLFERAD